MRRQFDYNKSSIPKRRRKFRFATDLARTLKKPPVMGGNPETSFLFWFNRRDNRRKKGIRIAFKFLNQVGLCLFWFLKFGFHPAWNMDFIRIRAIVFIHFHGLISSTIYFYIVFTNPAKC